MAAADQYDQTINDAAAEWNVDPALLKSVLLQESGGNPRAVSKAGALGLMQLMPDTARKLGVTDPLDPVQSIYGGAKYLSQALDAEKQPDAALLYYHGGPDWRRAYGPESAAYVPSVAARYRGLAAPGVQYAENKTNTATDATPGAPKVTDDEFLKSTGAAVPGGKPPASAGKPQNASGTPSDDEFLKATGAAPAATTKGTEATPTTTQSAPTPADMILAGETQGGPTIWSSPAEQRIAGAARAGFMSAPSLGTAPGNISVLTPQAQSWVEHNIPVVGPYVINPLAQMAGAGIGLVGAAGAAASQGVNEALTAAGTPGNLQRDLNILAMVAPAMTGEMTALSAMANTPRAIARAPRTPDYVTDVNPLSPEAAARGNVRAATGPPEATVAPSSPTGIEPPAPRAAAPSQPPVDAGGAATPRAAGAQATTAPIPDKTPAQRITDLEKTVTQTAEERAGPQLRDDTQYVQGIPPRLLAGREFRPQHSLDEKVAFAQDPVFRQDVEANRRQRNEGMVDLLRRDAQDANALDEAYTARQQVSPSELGVFDNEQPTSVEGIVAKIDKLLAGPEGKQRAVRNTLQDVRDSLHDADGNLETLPSQIYGSRKNLTDLLKRGVKGVGDVADDVRASKHVLESLVPDFDEVITNGAPKFRDYLKQWSDMSKTIDQMEFLQQYQTGSKKITDKDGYLIPTKVQKMLDDILQANKARGVNKGKSVTDQQIANIEAVRNELSAQSLQDRMGGVKGSDTFQQATASTKGGGNVATTLKIMSELGIGIPSGGIANLVLHHGVLPHLAKRREARAMAQITARKRELLSGPNPSPP